jgi:ribose/xylose/arabinose/galactoside ABC-type transport system permease subunit
MFAGTLAGLGGVLFTMRTGAGSQQAGSGIEMMGIVAAFLGGVGFGGAGSGLGAFLGALLVALVVNAIQLLGIATLWQNVVIGSFLIIAALVGMARYQKATQHIRKERRKEAEEA